MLPGLAGQPDRPSSGFELPLKENQMKFRVNVHSKPGMWKSYKGYVDIVAPTIHQAVSRALDKLLTGAFPNRPIGSWIVDSVKINRLKFEAEGYQSG